MVRDWLAGEEQAQVDRYLARAAATPVLEAVGDALPRRRGPADPATARAAAGCPSSR